MEVRRRTSKERGSQLQVPDVELQAAKCQCVTLSQNGVRASARERERLSLQVQSRARVPKIFG